VRVFYIYVFLPKCYAKGRNTILMLVRNFLGDFGWRSVFGTLAHEAADSERNSGARLWMFIATRYIDSIYVEEDRFYTHTKLRKSSVFSSTYHTPSRLPDTSDRHHLEQSHPSPHVMSSTKGKGIPIIDSHIHLYPASERSTLAWCLPSHPLSGQHSVDEYLTATRGDRDLEGFIFVETDRIHDLAEGARDGSGWVHPLAEVSWLQRIAQGEPHAGEGHSADQKHLCLAIVPWAPVPCGAEVLERYVALARDRAGPCWSKVRGFRYLVQYKPRGVMLQDGFVGALRWLGSQGFVFDQGIDTHRDGLEWMDDTLEMIARAHEGVPEEEKVTFIISILSILSAPFLPVHFPIPASEIYNPYFQHIHSLLMSTYA
jgi:hypothetical protein